MPAATNHSTLKNPVKTGDRVPGKRLEKYYAHVQVIHENYNGDVKNHRVPFNVIDAHIKNS